jgi:acyl dehydratase
MAPTQSEPPFLFTQFAVLIFLKAIANGSGGATCEKPTGERIWRLQKGNLPKTTMTDSNQHLFLEDLHPGQRFTSGSHMIDEAQIKAFAKQFDPQPFHLDDEAAKGSIFSGLAASGWHTAAITMRLQVESGLPISGGIIGAGGELSWPRPTRPGDILHVETEVLEVKPSRSRPERGMVTVRSETLNQRGEVVQTLTVKLVVPRRSVANVEQAGGS